jgi:plastocyanin
MGYFKELPNIQTINRTKNDISIDETIIIKNFFRRAKIREDIIDVVTAFEYYEITENETPSQVAEKVYGEPELDWVVLTTNNIINVQNDWPINNNSFNNYLIDKYGSEEALTEIHHYETIELKDSFGRTVLPEGLLVDQSFFEAPEFRSFATPPPGITFPPIIIPGTIASATAVPGVPAVPGSPADPEYNNGAIIDVVGNGSDFFKREVTTNGVRIMGAGAVGGQAAVPDAWLEKVARMFELFTDPTGAGINQTIQRQFIKDLSGDAGDSYHAGFPTLQRVARGAGSDYTPNFLTDEGIESWNLSPLFDTHVANDMVWYLNSTGDGYGIGEIDAQEVIEHVFHTLHMHGLPAFDLKMYPEFSADWQSGDLFAAIEEAYDAGVFDPSGYVDATWKTDPELFPVIVKEYLYLLNFCMFEYSGLWDGDSLDPEWSDSMRTQSGILANNPLGYALFNTYIAPVISKPSLATINSIFGDGNTPAQDDPSQAGASGYIVDVVVVGSPVVGIANLQSGLGYTSPPTVTFSAPPTTISASVNVSVSGFAVTSFNTLTGGKGYLSTPTITIEAPPDSVQPVATCTIEPANGEVLSINLINGGSGYGVTAPTITFSPSPNIIEGSYANQSSVAIGNQVDGMFIRENGLDLFTSSISDSGTAAGTQRIKQYSMSTAWDVTTVSFVRELDVSVDFSYCTGIEFRPDGTQMFVVGGVGSSYKLISYNLSTPWDISTATKLHQRFVTSPGGVRISPDGFTLFFLLASSSGEINQYDLSSAWNITTYGDISIPQKQLNLELLTGETINLGFSFSSNGLKLFTTGQSNSKLYEISLTSAYDLDGATFINDFYVGSQLDNPSDVFLKPDNTKFIVSGGSSDKLFEYLTISLATATATLTNGSVTNINLDSPGIGYTVAPTITISAPFPSVQATATAVMTAETVVTKTWSVINSANQSYLFTGSSSGSNIDIIATSGDTLIFNVNANGHPFWIKTAQTVGTGNSVTTGTITNNGVTGNIGVVIPITWNTTGVLPGTYYYVCQNHITMSGTITITAASTGSFVSSINLTNGGFGYIFNPSVSITPAPTYRTAVGFAVLNETTGISTVAIVDGGANYDSPPTITFGTPDEIQMIFSGDTYSQNNNTWRWNGTEWQEKFTEEFQYLDPVSATILKTRGNLISRAVTNYEYENDLNQKKRSIVILKPQYLSVIITDLKNIMSYDPESSTYINDKLKFVYNPKFTVN